MLMGFIIGCAGLAYLHTPVGFHTVIVGFGVGAGIWAALSSLAYVRFFGRLHLGEISGSAVSLSVAGSAIGPALFSAGKDFTGSYTAVAWLCCATFCGLLLSGACVVKRDAPPVRSVSAHA
jgi:cyanate permease